MRFSISLGLLTLIVLGTMLVLPVDTDAKTVSWWTEYELCDSGWAYAEMEYNENTGAIIRWSYTCSGHIA